MKQLFQHENHSLPAELSAFGDLLEVWAVCDNAMLLADPYQLYNYLLKELNKCKLLYVHMVEPRIGSTMNVIEVDESQKSLKPFKKLSNAAFIAAGG